MQTNLPVTQREYQFPDSETLLSTTDTSSHIGYVNAAFVRTSGYTVEELMGQAVAQLDEMTQQNAAMVEQSSASAISMGEQAQRLVAAVQVFSV